MSYHGRSLDDLPLAAYSTGMVEEEPDEEAESETARPAMDARAAALSIVEPQAAAAASAVSAAAGAPTLPAAAAAAGPAAAAYRPPFAAPGTPVDPPADEAAAPEAGARRRFALPRRPALSLRPQAWLSTLPRDPRAAIRDPRVLAGGVVVGALVLFTLFGRGAAPGAATPGATASPSAIVATPVPGAVTASLSGAVSGEIGLTGTAGFGHPAGGQLASTWTDGKGSSLTMTGEASAGTRPTGPDLVLTWTLVVKGTPETFTSDGGECVVGMAVKPSTVSGSIECRRLKSDDGKLMLNVSGTYRT
jgi:hypothetical protein